MLSASPFVPSTRKLGLCLFDLSASARLECSIERRFSLKCILFPRSDAVITDRRALPLSDP